MSSPVKPLRIVVKVKTRSHERVMKKISNPEQRGFGYVVSVPEKPVAGSANDAVIEVLAEYFDVAVSQISLVRGHRSKIKFFEIIQP